MPFPFSLSIISAVEAKNAVVAIGAATEPLALLPLTSSSPHRHSFLPSGHLMHLSLSLVGAWPLGQRSHSRDPTDLAWPGLLPSLSTP